MKRCNLLAISGWIVLLLSIVVIAEISIKKYPAILRNIWYPSDVFDVPVTAGSLCPEAIPHLNAPTTIAEDETVMIKLSYSSRSKEDCELSVEFISPDFNFSPTDAIRTVTVPPGNNSTSIEWLVSPKKQGTLEFLIISDISDKFYHAVTVTNVLGLTPLQAELLSILGSILGPSLTIPWWLERRKKVRTNRAAKGRKVRSTSIYSSASSSCNNVYLVILEFFLFLLLGFFHYELHYQVFINKLKMDPNFLLYILGLIIIFHTIFIMGTQWEKYNSTSNSLQSDKTLPWFIPRTMANMVIVGMSFGLIIGAMLVGFDNIAFPIPILNVQTSVTEFTAYLLGIILFLVCSKTINNSLSIAFFGGYIAGLATLLLLVYPSRHAAFSTYIFQFSLYIVVTVIANLNRVKNYMQRFMMSFLEQLIKERI